MIPRTAGSSSAANFRGLISTRGCWTRPDAAANPVLERLKFIAIFSSNLDEFFMVRIAGLRQLVKMGQDLPDPGREPPLRTARADAEEA